MARRQNFQTVSWFWDIQTRQLLNLDPPYQRRSVWSQSFKDYFIETLLLGYPAPAIFLYEDITPDGRSKYNVVDGKQRLTSVFEFIQGLFPVSDQSEIEQLRGKYFTDLANDIKKLFWGYQFLVEYLPVDEESIINNIFNRINRNVAKLTAQELRHAKFDGIFISLAEELSDLMSSAMPPNMPRFGTQSRKQMKDVELTALLLLLLEDGPKNYSQSDLDNAFVQREESWEKKIVVERLFRETIRVLSELVKPGKTPDLSETRLRNQADFYSLFGAISDLLKTGPLADMDIIRGRIAQFIGKVDIDIEREQSEKVSKYYDAARSASSDKGPRETRINIMKEVISGIVK